MKLQLTNSVSLAIKSARDVKGVLKAAQSVSWGTTFLKQNVLRNAPKSTKLWKEIENAFTQGLCVLMTITKTRIRMGAYLRNERVIKKAISSTNRKTSVYQK